MPRRIHLQILHPPCLRTILPRRAHSRLIRSPRKDARTRLVTVNVADLEGVIVQSRDHGSRPALISVLEELE